MSDGITPLNAQQEAKYEKQAAAEGYPKRVLIALDQFLNVLLTNGRPDETMSAHAARAATEGKWFGIFMSKFLDITFSKDHGAKAVAGDLIRAKIVEKMEENSGDLPK